MKPGQTREILGHVIVLCGYIDELVLIQCQFKEGLALDTIKKKAIMVREMINKTYHD